MWGCRLADMIAAHGPRARPAWATSIDLGSSPAQLAESFSRILPEHSCCCWSSAAQCSGAADRGTSPDVPSQPTHPRFITRLAVRDGTPALGSDLLERLAPHRACARGLSPAHLPLAPVLGHLEGKHLEALASNIG